MWLSRRSLILLALSCVEGFVLPSSGLAAPGSLRLSSSSASFRPVCRAQRDGIITMHASASAAAGDMAVSRRALLFSAFFASSQGAFAYDFREELVGDCKILVPAIWTKIDGGDGSISFADPVTGAVLQKMIVSSKPVATKGGGIKDLGRVESINLVKTLGVRPELGVADMVAAGKHGKALGAAYDYDLAIAPKQCSRSEEVVSGSCAYNEIVLVSALVAGEELKVLEISASAEQWKKNGPALRGVRDSFSRRRA